MRFESHSMRASQSDSQRHLMLELLVLMALCLVALCSAPTSSAQASDVYITPDGSGQGVCTNSPHPPAWFNSGANWGTGGTQIGPGTTVHLCGTFTGGAGVTFFTFQGSGTSSNYITLLFENNTILQAPYMNTGVSLNSKAFVRVNGGTNGVIQNTNNGDPAGGFANQQASVAVYAQGSHDYEIENLAISNMYVKSDRTYTGITNDASKCVSFNGSNVLIHDNVMHDAGWCLADESYGTGDTNVQIYNNKISHADHSIALAGGTSAGNFYVYGNDDSDHQNWDTNADDYHHNFLHAFNCSGGGGIAKLYVYNNFYHGNPGGNSTAAFFLEGNSCEWTSSSGTAYFWNNVFTTSGNIPGLGYMSISGGTGHEILNNVLIGPQGPNSCMQIDGSASIIENNIIEGCNQIYASIGATSFATIDYNTYANSASGNSLFQVGSINSGSAIGAAAFAAWQKACNCDSHSTYTNSALANLGSTGVPSAGFIGIGGAKNLMSIATGNLATLADSTTAGDSQTPTARLPMPDAWDTGAFSSGTVVSGPAAPTSLVATVN